MTPLVIMVCQVPGHRMMPSAGDLAAHFGRDDPLDLALIDHMQRLACEAAHSDVLVELYPDVQTRELVENTELQGWRRCLHPTSLHLINVFEETRNVRFEAIRE